NLAVRKLQSKTEGKLPDRSLGHLRLPSQSAGQVGTNARPLRERDTPWRISDLAQSFMKGLKETEVHEALDEDPAAHGNLRDSLSYPESLLKFAQDCSFILAPNPLPTADAQ